MAAGSSSRRSSREESGDVFALNGDELVAVDFAALLARHREAGGAATVTVTQPRSPFGVVDLGRGDTITGFSEGGSIPYWVSCGIYVLSEEALERFPDRGDHESTTFPELASEGRLFAYRHDGLWLTVNTPKELRTAADHVEAHPEWLAMSGPDVGSLAPWAAETRRVDKPWGYELIWAVTDIYVGKVLFVKAGESLSLQYHEQKDESWLIQSGLAKIELGNARRRRARRRGRRSRRRLPLSPRHRPPDHRGRGHDDPRGLDAAPRRRRAAGRQLRPRRHLGAVGVTKPARTRHTFPASVSEGPQLPHPGGAWRARGGSWTRPNLHTDVIRFGAWRS